MYLSKIFVNYYLIFNILYRKINEKITLKLQFKNTILRILLFTKELGSNRNETLINVLNRINVDIEYGFIRKTIRSKYQAGEMKTIFNDPDIKKQWYYVQSEVNKSLLSHDLEMLWLHRIYGTGVTIGIVDDGIDINHDELKHNYSPDLSYNFINNTRQIYFSADSKGTEAAGLIAAISNNWRCGVGAAPDSKFSSLQIYDNGPRMFKDIIMAKALMHLNNFIDIYLIHWYVDNELNLRHYPGFRTIQALKNGIVFGRNGFGNIYVAGSGNNKNLGNNCGFNGLLQREEILVIGAISHSGKSTTYSESCNAILAVALSNEDSAMEDKIYTTKSSNVCGNLANGSYTAAAMGAGILALLISNNPTLTVRQIIKLIAITSIQYDPYSVTNAAGFMYSKYLGFGMLNAYELISFSRNNIITSIGISNMYSTDAVQKKILVKKNSTAIVYIYSSGCLESSCCVTEIEHVLAVISIITRQRNAVTLYLTSPAGTQFTILEPQSSDYSKNGLHKWRLKLMGYMGEKAVGIWKARIFCSTNSCHLVRFELILCGSCFNPFINIMTHNIVKDFIYLHKNISKNVYDRLFYNPTITFNSIKGIDPLSFTSDDFPKFSELVAFLE